MNIKYLIIIKIQTLKKMISLYSTSHSINLIVILYMNSILYKSFASLTDNSYSADRNQ